MAENKNETDHTASRVKTGTVRADYLLFVELRDKNELPPGVPKSWDRFLATTRGMGKAERIAVLYRRRNWKTRPEPT